MCHRSLFVSPKIFVALFWCTLSTAQPFEAVHSISDGISAGGDFVRAEAFSNPPLSARPAAYWAWLNGNVSLPQLTQELEEMKDKGLSGAYIFDVGARDPEGIIPAGPAFMGPESLRAVSHAVKEATRLGLELGFVTSSSWNAGGTWVAPENASMGLYHSQTAVNGPIKFSQALQFPSIPNKTPKRPDGFPVYHKDVAVLAFPQTTDEFI